MAKLDMNDESEKDLVEQVFLNAIDSLSDDDKKLPQVDKILPILKRGIGIHLMRREAIADEASPAGPRQRCTRP